MKTNSRIEVVSETIREVTIRMERRVGGRVKASPQCPECLSAVLTINEAVRISGRSWEEVVRLFDHGAVHKAETIRGEVFVCADSLFAVDSDD